MSGNQPGQGNFDELESSVFGHRFQSDLHGVACECIAKMEFHGWPCLQRNLKGEVQRLAEPVRRNWMQRNRLVIPRLQPADNRVSAMALSFRQQPLAFVSIFIGHAKALVESNLQLTIGDADMVPAAFCATETISSAPSERIGSTAEASARVPAIPATPMINSRRFMTI